MARTIDAPGAPPVTPSIDPAEVAKFSAMAADWWNPNGKFKPLHRFNPTRLRFIRETAERHFGLAAGLRKPLDGLRLLDIGCGGGLVSEPMSRLGAAVTGVDASEANIKTALTHADEQGLKIDYRAGTAEGLLASGEALFDIVLNMEVVEHVADPAQFLADTARLVRPGGLMIVATLNKTAKSLATAVIGAEYILRWLPPGTHDWSKFLAPEDVTGPLQDAGMETEPPVGVSFQPVSGEWKLSSDLSVNYMVVARRPAP
ncbi:bifunctional 2-polyprenyl-6-hydroxyphenol methylase/3-demethylubiquinol 3-O-methyltransferase UbiG [Hyphomonas sp. WL0036]|uniref:bifunctional 2-polyprenyl-6-hydroxyphenol methylase/3-demethylubiquinol 3-O-methyltransferase UbiG n=1 Tax=Hyphomonas sediminis TaxID=2866160 RepID=UPI001C7FD5CF|nr:bifunctional 2-polyprenyl-6-hydroxyphenol methylase/3-demethylubiquinol 3-O-methyltransferase UbiG [Hyphomonas sediminis]MBY9065424.1 bifunctional 2-polyprenyl-6-hydroxyphenol methylase/3-demethylubiquinol 3-O-methyltransferase UbiG [Hyphomonas sediminis]